MWSLIACSGFPKKDLNGSASSDFLTCSFTASKPGIGSFADCAWKSIFSWTYNKPVVIRAVKWNNSLWTKIADETGFRKSKSEVLLRHYLFWRASYASYPQNSSILNQLFYSCISAKSMLPVLRKQVKNFLLVRHWMQFLQLEMHSCLCFRCMRSPCAPPGSWLVHMLPLGITWLVVGWTTSAPFITWKLVKGMFVSAVSSLGTQVRAAQSYLSTVKI